MSTERHNPRRQNIRNAYSCAKIDELWKAWQQYVARGDMFGADCIQEIIIHG